MLEYIDIYEAEEWADTKKALAKLIDKHNDVNLELRQELKDYCFIVYEGYMFQIKYTDDINNIKDNYEKRIKVKDLSYAKDLLVKDIRAGNRLIDRIVEFLKIDKKTLKEEERPEYFKELRLMSRQLAQQSTIPCFHYRLFYDLFEDAGYKIIPYTEDCLTDFNKTIDFLIGQIMYSLINYTEVSYKFNKVFNTLKTKIEG